MFSSGCAGTSLAAQLHRNGARERLAPERPWQRNCTEMAQESARRAATLL